MIVGLQYAFVEIVSAVPRSAPALIGMYQEMAFLIAVAVNCNGMPSFLNRRSAGRRVVLH